MTSALGGANIDFNLDEMNETDSTWESLLGTRDGACTLNFDDTHLSGLGEVADGFG